MRSPRKEKGGVRGKGHRRVIPIAEDQQRGGASRQTQQSVCNQGWILRSNTDTHLSCTFQIYCDLVNLIRIRLREHPAHTYTPTSLSTFSFSMPVFTSLGHRISRLKILKDHPAKPSNQTSLHIPPKTCLVPSHLCF